MENQNNPIIRGYHPLQAQDLQQQNVDQEQSRPLPRNWQALRNRFFARFSAQPPTAQSSTGNDENLGGARQFEGQNLQAVDL